MVGGEDADFERARPLFEAMGELIVHVGEVGHGQMVKVINNAVGADQRGRGRRGAAGRRAAPASTSTRSSRSMGAGSGGSTMLELKAEPMLEHDYAPLFKLEHMLKDVAPLPGGGARRRRRRSRSRALARRELYSAGVGRGLRRAGLRRRARGRRGPRRDARLSSTWIPRGAVPPRIDPAEMLPICRNCEFRTFA